jgi:hypothetical protein
VLVAIAISRRASDTNLISTRATGGVRWTGN